MKEGTYSISPKDFLAMLSKADVEKDKKIHAKLCTHPSGNILLSFIFKNNCEYIIAIAKEK